MSSWATKSICWKEKEWHHHWHGCACLRSENAFLKQSSWNKQFTMWIGILHWKVFPALSISMRYWELSWFLSFAGPSFSPTSGSRFSWPSVFPHLASKLCPSENSFLLQIWVTPAMMRNPSPFPVPLMAIGPHTSVRSYIVEMSLVW